MTGYQFYSILGVLWIICAQVTESNVMQICASIAGLVMILLAGLCLLSGEKE